jgi:hypothetical protein
MLGRVHVKTTGEVLTMLTGVQFNTRSQLLAVGSATVRFRSVAPVHY